MRVIFLNMFLPMLIIGSAFANGDIQQDKRDDYLAKMFSYANAHDTDALEEMRSEIESESDRTLNIAYSLALYIASPKKYEKQFVENFPTDRDGLMKYLFGRIEAEGLPPRFMYSVRSLAKIAEEGNEQAIEKVFQGCLHTGASVAVAFSEASIKVFEKQTEKSLRIFSLLSEKDRQKIYSLTFEYVFIDPEEFREIKNNLEKLRPRASAKEAQVIQEIKEIEP